MAVEVGVAADGRVVIERSPTTPMKVKTPVTMKPYAAVISVRKNETINRYGDRTSDTYLVANLDITGDTLPELIENAKAHLDLITDGK